MEPLEFIALLLVLFVHVLHGMGGMEPPDTQGV